MQVDVLMLDLDVGFVDSPMNIVRKLQHSKSDIFVQVQYAMMYMTFPARHDNVMWFFVCGAARPGVRDESQPGRVAHLVHRAHAQYR